MADPGFHAGDSELDNLINTSVLVYENECSNDPNMGICKKNLKVTVWKQLLLPFDSNQNLSRFWNSNVWRGKFIRHSQMNFYKWLLLSPLKAKSWKLMFIRNNRNIKLGVVYRFGDYQTSKPEEELTDGRPNWFYYSDNSENVHNDVIDYPWLSIKERFWKHKNIVKYW